MKNENSMAQCIWCKSSNSSRSIEHIIPEALGCPENFVLGSGTVCTKCNNNLAHLDKAVIDDFDFFCFMNAIPQKGKRRPEIRSRGNLIATSNPRKITINMGNKPIVLPDGSKLGVYGKSKRNIKSQFNVNGKNAVVKFSTEIGQSHKFVRGIYKIGLSTLAFFLGGQKALGGEFDKVRSFVRSGDSSRSILIQPAGDKIYKNEAWPPYVLDNAYCVIFRLAYIIFYVDLSNNQSIFPILKAKAAEIYGPTGWTYLPLS